MAGGWTVWLMRGFVGAVCVGCLFGPYAISILIGALALGCHLMRDEGGSQAR